MAIHRNRCFLVVDPPTDDDLAATNEVLNAYTFPWEWTLRDNIRDTGKPDLPISFEDRSGSSGFYTPMMNSVNVDSIVDHMGGRDRFGLTLAHELGHYIDDAVLASETKVAIHKLMHADNPTRPYEQCPSLPANQEQKTARVPPESVAWFSGKVPHNVRPGEAFGNLAPHIWCPDYAKQEDGYGPYHLFTRLDEIRDLVLADAVQRPPFNDIAGHTFEKDILWAAGQGIAFGHRGRFDPDASVSRGQMTAFIRRAVSGLPEDFAMPDPTDNVTFNDITEHTFEADILWAARQGIAKGGSDGNFRPNDPVTRGAMAAFLHRALGDK